MARIVPHDIDYKVVNRFDSVCDRLLYSSATTSAAVIFVDLTTIVPLSNKVFLLTLLNSFLSVFALGYFVLDIFQNYYFQKAEETRRKDLIDNGFGTQLANANSAEYYSNDTYSYGIKKLGINCFENAYYSKEISKRMFAPALQRSIVIIVLFLVVVFSTSTNFLNSILQIALPFTILQKTIKLKLYNHRLCEVFEGFKNVFSNIPAQNQEPLVIFYMMKYETTLAWASISLDSKIWEKNDAQFEQDWTAIKARYIR
ncbi:MAG: hypothetical protein EOO15_06045 [Chitinophagaceae bacterium]|nr:MAG: hypothetical protein EOO15_06045 [Chitinophagaceae bacterium]